MTHRRLVKSGTRFVSDFGGVFLIRPDLIKRTRWRGATGNPFGMESNTTQAESLNRIGLRLGS